MPRNLAEWSVWITILTLTVTVASVISGLIEAKNTCREINITQTRDIDALKSDRRSQDKMSAMDLQITRLEVVVSTLQSQAQESRAAARRR